MENYDSYIGEDAPEHPSYMEEPKQEVAKESKTFDLEFVCIDDWCRPIWKVVDKEVYFSSVNILVPNATLKSSNTKEEINAYFREHSEEITFHGGSIDCDPNGGRADHWVYNIID